MNQDPNTKHTPKTPPRKQALAGDCLVRSDPPAGRLREVFAVHGVGPGLSVDRDRHARGGRDLPPEHVGQPAPGLEGKIHRVDPKFAS